ncbi:MAG: hypothetical protein ACXV7J_09600 [Methylomonas sp.]
MMEVKNMKYLILTNIMIVIALASSPAFAIKKCTEKYTVGYSQFECPETAIKSELYDEKLGAPARNPMPRYKKSPDEHSKQPMPHKKAKPASKTRTDRAINIDNEE